MTKQRGLGRGLEALLSVSNVLPTAHTNAEEVINDLKSDLQEVNIDKIVLGSYQPRKIFDGALLEELAKSIKQNGIIQPLVVRKVRGSYELIAGERRLRASIIAGLKKVPVVVKKLSDKEALAIALVENIQRKDLNIVEEAEGYKRLIEEFKLTHENLSSITGKSRSHITNILRLLNLDPEVLDFLLNGHLTMGHSRALLPLPANLQFSLAKEIIKHNLTTAEVEGKVARLLNGSSSNIANIKNTIDANLIKLENRFAKKIGMSVNIKPNQKGGGKIVIAYESEDKLNNLLELL